MTPTPSAPLATLEAVLERIIYANDETGYTVARVATRGGGSDLLTVVGSLLGAQPGESLRLEGVWKAHPQYGRQFEGECVLDIGTRAGRHRTGCRDKHRPVGRAQSTR